MIRAGSQQNQIVDASCAAKAKHLPLRHSAAAETNRLMMKTARSIAATLCLALSCLAVLPLNTAAAQTVVQGKAPVSATQEAVSAKVDQLSAALGNMEKSLENSKPNQAALDEMRQQVGPIVTESQAIVDRLAPRLKALQTRLDQLGPKPDAKAPPESAEVTKERTDAQALFDSSGELLKRAKLLAVKAEQDDHYLGVRQRAEFNHNLFQRETSIVSPALWLAVIAETPTNLGRAKDAFDEWASGFNANLTGTKLLVFWGAVFVIVLLYWPLTRLARRVLRRERKVEHPTAWQKIIVACWTSISVSALLIALMYCVAFAFSFFSGHETRLAPLFSAIQGGVIRVALAAGLARGILSPGHPNWRLVNLDDKTCDKLIRIIIAVAIILSGTRIIEALNEVIGASLQFSVACRGVGALLVAGAMAVALLNLGDDPQADTSGASKSTARRDWYGLIRGVAWTVIIAITASVLAGYVAFGSFLVEQIVLIGATSAVFFLAATLVDEACGRGLEPSSMFGRTLIYTVGLRREGLEQLAILLAGALRLILIAVAALVIMVPWGLQSTDIPGNLYAIFFGFKVGDFTVSLAGIAFALLTFLIVIAATRGIQGWLENQYLPHTRLDAGLQNSIKTSLGYVGFVIALAVAAANLGVDFQKLAIVAGALSVGIGFGLQSIVNNFVSGLILLWERAVRVGDWIVVGADQGYVRRINVRSTEIETFDRAAVIIPNSNLVSGIVKNLMRTDRVGRLMIELTVDGTADPEKVREALIDIARDNDAILSLPSPQVRFTNLTASAMTFDLYCFVADVESMVRTKSDLYFEIHKQFKERGFFNAPAPDPLAIKIDGLDRLETILHGVGPRAEAENTPPLKTAASA